MTRSRSLMRVRVLSALFVTPFVAGCEQNQLPFAPMVGAVTSFRDSLEQFADDSTFAFVDTIVHLAPFTDAPLLFPLPRKFDQVILDRVRQHLLERGFVEETNPVANRPDFVVVIGASAQMRYEPWSSYDWYSWYGFYRGWAFENGGFDDSWGLNYRWGGSARIKWFNEGTLIISIFDTRSIQRTSKRVNVLWTGIAVALLNGAVTEFSAVNAVDGMFTTSPYLRRN